ncbi:hypothetical protein B0H19DRAFT_1260389 [Mycena capillaripes]|nr:hypothetical protein B0H19DRAFT_1260389 [Mycena capillaripes]
MLPAFPPQVWIGLPSHPNAKSLRTLSETSAAEPLIHRVDRSVVFGQVVTSSSSHARRLGQSPSLDRSSHLFLLSGGRAHFGEPVSMASREIFIDAPPPPLARQRSVEELRYHHVRERALLKIVEGTTLKPVAADPDNPTTDEKRQRERWEELDGKSETQIEFTLSDSQMVHIAGTKTAAEMWSQMKQVKER